MKPKIKQVEAVLIQDVIGRLSRIVDRNQDRLPEIDYEDLLERMSGAITDLTWLLDYSERDTDLPEGIPRYEDF
jgi:hypothetical protein